MINKYLFSNYPSTMSTLADFQIIGKIGQGLYSTVYKARRIQDNTIYAVKQVKLIDMPTKQVTNALNQIRILASIRHPNVIGYREAFYDQFSKLLCIVMEYADGGDLEQKITDHRNRGIYFKQNQIWEMFSQMLAGINKLHELGILHRDIKSANFYLTRNGIVKIGDMNVSKIIRKTGMCETQTGAPYYASPEVWKEEAYDTKSDMWSLGCVLYELINLKLPFKARDMEGLFKKVTRGYYSRINKSYSDDLSEVLKYLINVNPRQRKYCVQLMSMPIVKRNMKKIKDLDLQQKSMLLKTIKLNKNLSFISNSLPKSNYPLIRYKCESLNQSMGERSHSHEIKNNSSFVKLQKISPTVKLSLPPVPILNKNEKIQRYDESMKDQSPKRKISSQKNIPKYKRARSYIRK